MKLALQILEKTIFGISIQNILISLLIFIFFVFLRSFLSNILLNFLKKLTKNTKSTIDDRLLNAFESPFRFAFIILGFYFSAKWICDGQFNMVLQNFFNSCMVFLIFWTIFRLVNEFNALISLFSSRLGKPLNKDIENFIVKTSKVLIVILGFLMILQTWGINIATFIASLGLGGLAFALAAKDTTANLFGSLVIFADRPFRIGDSIEVNGTSGSVEDIGIRSTRIRTYENTLVSIPNAVVAHASIENFTKRQKRRCKIYLGLTYDTSLDQMQNIIGQISLMIKNRDKVDEDSVIIYFEEFGDSALNILCQYHVKTTDYKEFLGIKQDINLSIMKIVEQNNCEFAFPSRTLYVQNLKAKDSDN